MLLRALAEPFSLKEVVNSRKIVARSFVEKPLAVSALLVTRLTLISWFILAPCGNGDELPEAMEDLLDFYCYDCHGYGKKEGDIQLDELSLSADHGNLWERIWLNVRTGMMPPAEGEPLEPDEKKELLDWLERNPLGIDRTNPDPGRVTVRRHNRVEYETTIQDLLAIEFDSKEQFPPDDTGYGFDTIGDVLTISPLLAERYFEAASQIMAQAVPDNAGTTPRITLTASDLVNRNNKTDTGRFIEFNRPQVVSADRTVHHAGKYELVLTYSVSGSSKATRHSGTLLMGVSGRELNRIDLGWDFSAKRELKATVELEPGRHRFALQTLEREKPKEGQGELGVSVESFRITGPLDSGILIYPESYRRVIPVAHQPKSRDEWAEKTKVVLNDFASKAWRRPISEESLTQLTALALDTAEADDSFESGIRQAGTAILTSPRFLLRTEFTQSSDQPNEKYPFIDEWSLASRLSYFLWSSLPDEQLFAHAAAGTLRENLSSEIDRMLMDTRSNRFVTNFIGQWLQARDVTTLGIRAEIVLGMRTSSAVKIFSSRLRQDMQSETETLFRYILDNKRPAVELINANYSFLNKRLADFYQIEGVEGELLQKMELPAPRGGILTQGTFLVVTSNPTRTSPVKRGLFVLDNLLGTPPPPAPPDIPELEDAGHGNANLTMRERMVEHRKNPDCRSCHARMDPIGLAFENFTAIGSYREEENGKLIETEGKLVTGEEFADVTDLKQVLAVDRRDDFHRCLVEKILTYALGRGIEYYDAPAIDEIVNRMEKADGSLHEAIHAVIESASFQKRRAH